jgi:pimeloyl-ACP methyl ester carboxylesterase
MACLGTTWDDLPRELIPANGIRLSVRDSGASDGGAEKPTILLLHGWPQTSYAFRKVVGELSAEYRVVIPDLRGLGASEGTPAGTTGGYDVRTLAEDIRALVSSPGWSNPTSWDTIGAD